VDGRISTAAPLALAGQLPLLMTIVTGFVGHDGQFHENGNQYVKKL